MAFCAKCGSDIGEAHICPQCGEMSAYQSQPVMGSSAAPEAAKSAAPAQPAVPVGQPVVINQPSQAEQPQTLYNQPASFAYQTQTAPKGANPLVIITGIVLIALGLYSVIQSIVDIVSFMDLISLYSSSFVGMDLYPWPSVIFGLFVDVVIIATGVLALIFLKKPQRSMIITILAAASGGLTIIQCLMFLFSQVGSLINYGIEYFDFASSIIFGTLEVPFIVSMLFTLFLFAVVLAAAVILFICSLRARKQGLNR